MGTPRTLRRIAVGGALMIGLACGCGDSTPSATADCALPGTESLHAHSEARFCIVVARTEGAPELRAEIEPRDPWKIATEYPHRLELDTEPEGLRIDRDQAREASTSRVAFALPIPATASGTTPGRLSFGVCQTDAICHRVDHAFEIALEPR